jgi:hypothetical protein
MQAAAASQSRSPRGARQSSWEKYEKIYDVELGGPMEVARHHGGHQPVHGKDDVVLYRIRTRNFKFPLLRPTGVLHAFACMQLPCFLVAGLCYWWPPNEAQKAAQTECPKPLSATNTIRDSTSPGLHLRYDVTLGTQKESRKPNKPCPKDVAQPWTLR